MEALDKFYQFERFMCPICNAIGFNVLSKEWKKNYRTYTSIFLCGQYFIWMVWSIIIASDAFELLKSLSFLGFFFQCSLKMYYTSVDAALYGINFDGLKQTIYIGHTNGTPEQKSVIERIIGIVLLIMKVTTVLYTSSLLIFALYPAYMYFVVGVKVPIFPLYVPGIDIYSAYGYGMTNTCHMAIAVYGCLGAIASDNLFMMFVLHFVTYVELFRIECEQFQDDLKEVDERCERHMPEYQSFCRQRMRDLYQYHQKVILYIESLQECYQSICVVQVGNCSFSLMFNLFLALTTDWYATYGFMFISWFQLFIYSLLGTIMQLMNDRLMRYIWNLPWYMLPSDEQKRFIFMLSRSQLPAEMVVQSVGPLNMETFTDIMQKVYSAFTMMYSFLVDLN
ncbi:putative odorant receptor 83c [Anopheles marshallii]|uniref:putative odorant receptor 83c n=1 Tax=Anopheles marshallii TaxID=1521116 RepID=UPI00237B177D|nr:putative odorant receptor 83c [Anopheles marshallii]